MEKTIRMPRYCRRGLQIFGYRAPVTPVTPYRPPVGAPVTPAIPHRPPIGASVTPAILC